MINQVINNADDSFEDDFQKRLSLSKAIISFSKLSPESSDYDSTVSLIVENLFDLISLKHHPTIVVDLNEDVLRALVSLGLIEQETNNQDDNIHVKNIPCYERDKKLHIQVVELRKIAAELCYFQGEKDISFEDLSQYASLSLAKQQKTLPQSVKTKDQIVRAVEDIVLQTLNSLIDVAYNNSLVLEGNDAHIRLTPHGVNLANFLLDFQSDFHKELLSKIFLELSRTIDRTKLDHISLLLCEHIRDLTELEDFDRDLRKLAYAIMDKDPLIASGKFDFRFKNIKVDHQIDHYLEGQDISKTSKAANYLRDRDGGCYCPAPFPSWSGRVEEILQRARKIVLRGRREAYSFGRDAIEFKRMPDGGDSLAVRFAKENAEQVFGLYSTNYNIPPGSGILVNSPRVNKLFFSDFSKLDTLSQYRQQYGEWLSSAFDFFEDTTFIFMRGAKVVVNTDPFFRINGTQYARIIFNDHLGGGYGGEWLFPSVVVSSALSPCLFELGSLENNDKPKDLSKQGFTLNALFQRSIELGLSPLNLSGISTLFGGCSYSFPVCSSPFFGWEREHMSTYWKDASGHVHSSYRIWQYKEDKARVDATLAPLQKLDDEVYRVVSLYQSLSALYALRYSAWKNDQTPGIIEAPIMLRDLYRWNKAKDCHLDPVYLCLIDRRSLSLPPIPIADSSTLQLNIGGQIIQLPESSDGCENKEISIWNQYVRPLILNDGGREGNCELVFLKSEYLE